MPRACSVGPGRTAGCQPKSRLGQHLRSLRGPGAGPGVPWRPAGRRRPRLHRPWHDAGPQRGGLDCRGPLIGLAPQHQLDCEPVRPGRANPGMPGAWRPSLRRAGQSQGWPPVSQHGVRSADAGGRRKHAVGDRQDSLDQASDAGRGSRVADVAGDRAEHANPLGAGTEHGQRRELGVVDCADSQAAALEQLDIDRLDHRHVVRPAHGEQPCACFRRQLMRNHRPGRGWTAARRYAPAPDLGVNGQARSPGVGCPRQQHHAAAFAGQKSGRQLVVHPHVALRKLAGLGECDQLKRVDAQVDAPGHGDVDLAS